MSKERWYRLSQEEKFVWDKLSEAANATILGHAKTLHKPSNHVKFHVVTLNDLIKASSHQFGFGDTPNGTSNNDIIYRDHHTDNDGNTPIILANLSNMDTVSPVDISNVLSKPNLSSKQG